MVDLGSLVYVGVIWLVLFTQSYIASFSTFSTTTTHAQTSREFNKLSSNLRLRIV